MEVCSNYAIIDLIDELRINPYWCTDCGSCESMCYENAIGYEGLDLSVPEEEIIYEDIVIGESVFNLQVNPAC